MLADKLTQVFIQWTSEIGDTTFWSWVITATYILAILLSFQHAKRLKSEKSAHLLWIYIATFLLLLGINKQLDLQILVIYTGKALATSFDFWHYSDALYILTAALILVLFVFTGFVIIKKTGGAILQRIPAALGIVILILFIIIRSQKMGFKGVHGLELLGQSLVLFNIFIEKRKLHQKLNRHSSA